MVTYNVSLPPASDEFVAGLVESGEYSSASEIIRQGVRVLERQHARRSKRLGRRVALKTALWVGDADLLFRRYKEVPVDKLPGYLDNLRQNDNQMVA